MRVALLFLGIIYVTFISLGLPDSLLGVGWPEMYGELGVPQSYAGFLSMTISLPLAKAAGYTSLPMMFLLLEKAGWIFLIISQTIFHHFLINKI